MLAALLRGQRDLHVEKVEDPDFGPEEVLVRVRSAGICGSDLHVYRNFEHLRQRIHLDQPLILGHEFSGDVVGVGAKVTDVRVGERVVVDPNLACGKCPTCRHTNNSALCEHLRIYGSAFAELAVAHHGNTYRLSQSTSYDDAAYCEPLSCALRAMDLLSPQPGRSLAVIGCGPAGLLFVLLARLGGAGGIIAVGRRAESLALARRLGADTIIDSQQEDPPTVVRLTSNGEGVATVVDTVGTPASARLSAEIASRGGRICFFALPSDESITLPSWEIFDKELTMTGSNRNSGTFERSLALVESGRMPLCELTSHSVGLRELPAMFGLLSDEARKKSAGIIKAVVHP